MNSNNIMLKADDKLYSVPAYTILCVVVRRKHCHVFTDNREYVIKSSLSHFLDGPAGDSLELWSRSIAYNPNRVTGFTLSVMHFGKLLIPLLPSYNMDISEDCNNS